MKNLSRLTGVPLDVYKEIASSHGLYTENKFQYLLKGQTRKKNQFPFTDVHIKTILCTARDFYNTQSSSSVKISKLEFCADHFELTLVSSFPLETPSRSLALFAQKAIEHAPFSNMVIGTSVFQYEDVTKNIRDKIYEQYIVRQKTMSDADFLTYFVQLMTNKDVSLTNAQTCFIQHMKRELYEFMEHSESYIPQQTSC